MALRASTAAVVGACTAVESACDAVIRTANTVDTDLQTVERLADRIGQEAGLLTNRLSSLPTAALGSLVGGAGGGAAQEGGACVVGYSDLCISLGGRIPGRRAGDTWVPPADGIGRKEGAASAPRLSFSARNVFATGEYVAVPRGRGLYHSWGVIEDTEGQVDAGEGGEGANACVWPPPAAYVRASMHGANGCAMRPLQRLWASTSARMLAAALCAFRAACNACG